MNESPNGNMEKTAIGAMDMEERTQMVPQPGAEATQFAVNIDCPVCRTPNPPSETYCIDCGFVLSAAPVAVAEVAEAPRAGVLITADGTREFPLKEGENSVGRESADVLLAHNTVSRKHAKITVEAGRAVVEDFGSTNGTSVDGRRLTEGETADIADGAELLFGSAAVRYEAPEVLEVVAEDAGDAEEQPAAEAAAEACGVEAAEAEAVEPEEAGPVEVGRLVSTDGACGFGLKEGVNTLGRREGANDIVVPDPYASGRHADLLVQNGTFTLTDTGSTNGTLVNGARLEPDSPRVLLEGDEITIGRIVFRIEVA